MLDLARRRAASALIALASSFILVACGGSDDPPPPPPLFATTVVVGASATDTGNRCEIAADPLCFPTPAYAGRSTASNGPLFSQILATRYGGPLVASSAGGLNFAVGGARTGAIPTDTAPAAIPSLQVQVEQYLQRVGFQASPRHLYIVDASAFGNNIRRVLEMVSANPALASTLPTQAVQQAASDVFTVVGRLYAAGARHVLLVNSTNLGLHPAVAASGPNAVALATAMSTGFNGALASQVVPGLIAASSGLSLYYLDVGALSNELVTNPAAFGFTNTMAPCYPFFSAPAAPICANPNQFLFWDELHPSAAVHAIIAQRAAAIIGL